MSLMSNPIQHQATVAGDTIAAATACLPQDVLAGILVRLPASDLRRLRRVCKEWREIISNPAFIDDHADHGPRTLTHTIAFFPGQPCRTKFSDHGSGFLFDDQWRLVATFSAPRFDEMIGQCNGLLCFLDGIHRNLAIYIVEPFSGESLTLPLAPQTELRDKHTAYCFGFDPSSRRYKIFHRGQKRYNVTKQDMFVYTIGVDDDWRRVEVAPETAVLGVCHGNPVFADGSVYWSVVTGHHARLARFDLATEDITTEPIDPVREELMSQSFGFLRDQVGASLAVMLEEDTSESLGFLQRQERTSLATSLAIKTNSDGEVPAMKITLPHKRRLAWPHALQRDQLLLNDYHWGGLYAHTIAPASNDLGCGELLVEALMGEIPASSSIRGLFVPVQISQKRATITTRNGDGGGRRARVFSYAPTVSPAPLAHYFGRL